jgi:hypothetical protein
LGPTPVAASYGGDLNFNGSATLLSYTVGGCSRTITGTQATINTAPGTTTCLFGATVSGAINVAAGSSIDIENSTIAGSFNASHGAGEIPICGSTIGGSLEVDRAHGLVRIGDPAFGCGTNTITDALVLQNNSHGVRAVGNKVGSWWRRATPDPGPTPALTVASPGVLANDVVQGSGTLTSSLVSGPSHGTVTPNANGSFTYVPAAGYFGTDSFTYQDSDGIQPSNIATVTINVHAPPVAVNDSYTAVEGTALTVAAPGVLANDSAPSGGTLAGDTNGGRRAPWPR